MRTFFLIMSAVGVVSAWANSALKDEKITVEEVGNLLIDLAKAIGFDVIVKVGSKTFTGSSQESKHAAMIDCG